MILLRKSRARAISTNDRKEQHKRREASQFKSIQYDKPKFNNKLLILLGLNKPDCLS